MPWFGFIALSLLLIFFASAPFIVSPPRNVQAPVLTILRMENGEFFAKENLKNGPILYGWLHAIPGGIWSALMPFQHVKSLRRKYPVLHRWSGRIIIALSLTLAISSMTFGPNNLIFSASTTYIHKMKVGVDRPITVLAWPSFRMLVWFLSPTLMISALQTIRTARAKQFDRHQYWASVLTAVGYSIPMQRVMMIILSIIAAHLQYLSPEQRAFFHIPNDNAPIIEKSQVERAAFSATAWASVVVMTIWSVTQSYCRNVELEKVKKAKA
ncbi:uncharacterized protein FA14DRAFT_154206 [Meira miltonrushii]|uniref:DUF2306 domain-containing protein n=1 Tax=Meira miltonrushii TaxID=1280837 RepID=A0A316VEN3_9BASI|nr:uncharacterized protein FA14DRAFT_154206 [Meira miltonrushii]PWN34763.1 hypothetical protein FA14DRAFT_154206 [Meira miltonrushii]